MTTLRSLLLLSVLVPVLKAEPRIWKNTDASSSFEGEWVAETAATVTIRRSDGKEFELSKSKLHTDDLTWLAQKDAPPEEAVFDTLCFGDTRADVEAKLLKSKVVEPIVDPKFLGRMGLNGSFRTRQKIGGQPCLLFFTWNQDTLSEILLRTDGGPASTYDSSLRATWEGLIGLLTELHGKPVQNASYPKKEALPDGGFLGSHLWHLPHGGSALLGTSREGDAYQTAIRFTAEKVQPVVTH
ncbi:hypothetical protein HNR46_002021 [Haloferula luteola]|uniref:SLA1 homology domain-containing protein n=1 Tax=Haloferula luteola TaxID=595692 RepID=A0A840V1A5_9BACT|nr:hypothetical protein [Haloferula luteola]MBB5351782.1 hypothetical protein [Haloferula luteola]